MYHFFVNFFKDDKETGSGFGCKPPLYEVERGLGVSTFFKTK